MTQKSAGGSTQLTSLVSAVLLIAVLLGIGPVLAALPKVKSVFFLETFFLKYYHTMFPWQCILAAVVAVAMFGPIQKIKELPDYMKKSWLDGFLWFGSFLCVVLTGAQYGIVITIVLTILIMVYRNYHIAILDGDGFHHDTQSIDSEVCYF